MRLFVLMIPALVGLLACDETEHVVDLSEISPACVHRTYRTEVAGGRVTWSVEFREHNGAGTRVRLDGHSKVEVTYGGRGPLVLDKVESKESLIYSGSIDGGTAPGADDPRIDVFAWYDVDGQLLEEHSVIRAPKLLVSSPDSGDQRQRGEQLVVQVLPLPMGRALSGVVGVSVDGVGGSSSADSRRFTFGVPEDAKLGRTNLTARHSLESELEDLSGGRITSSHTEGIVFIMCDGGDCGEEDD